MDVFVWTPIDMPGIDPSMMVHPLYVNLRHHLVKQKKWNFVPQWQRTIAKEVDKLLQAGFIKETTYPKWIANVVMVNKVNGKWCICIDFIDLNKAYSKDSYSLLRIDQLVDATSDHELLTFIDTFCSYNQI